MRRRRFSKNRFLKRALLVLLIVIIIGWQQYSGYLGALNVPVNPDDNTTISFIIQKGENLSDITEKLLEKELILDKKVFKMYTRLGGYDRNVIAGRFVLNKTLTIPEIVDVITNTTKSQIVLTIPEGSTIQDIDDKLVQLQLTKPNEFIAATNAFNEYENYHFLKKETVQDLPHPLEGYLFPDTYFLDPVDFHSENLIQLMLSTFEKRIGGELKTADRPIHEIVTMASIVEKEVRTTKDIPIVAGILWKRLDNNWLLGADATLLYQKEDNTIEYEDLQENSPYNTRKNGGLPPGPITNPGLKSFTGTLHPEQSPYWFYLTTLDTGEVIYAISNEEHNQNKAKYL